MTTRLQIASQNFPEKKTISLHLKLPLKGNFHRMVDKFNNLSCILIHCIIFDRENN